MISQWTWDDVKEDFFVDGSWRDIYVLDTTFSDWQKVIDAIWEKFSPNFLIDGKPASFPDRVEQVWQIRKHATALLSFSIDGMRLNCHFFNDSDIEFDLDPREVTGIDRAHSLISFMEMLGRTSVKTVVMTLENLQEAVLFKYFPEQDAVFWMRPLDS